MIVVPFLPSLRLARSHLWMLTRQALSHEGRHQREAKKRWCISLRCCDVVAGYLYRGIAPTTECMDLIDCSGCSHSRVPTAVSEAAGSRPAAPTRTGVSMMSKSVDLTGKVSPRFCITSRLRLSSSLLHLRAGWAFTCCNVWYVPVAWILPKGQLLVTHMHRQPSFLKTLLVCWYMSCVNRVSST